MKMCYERAEKDVLLKINMISGGDTKPLFQHQRRIRA